MNESLLVSLFTTILTIMVKHEVSIKKILFIVIGSSAIVFLSYKIYKAYKQ